MAQPNPPKPDAHAMARELHQLRDQNKRWEDMGIHDKHPTGEGRYDDYEANKEKIEKLEQEIARLAREARQNNPNLTKQQKNP